MYYAIDLLQEYLLVQYHKSIYRRNTCMQNAIDITTVGILAVQNAQDLTSAGIPACTMPYIYTLQEYLYTDCHRSIFCSLHAQCHRSFDLVCKDCYLATHFIVESSWLYGFIRHLQGRQPFDLRTFESAFVHRTTILTNVGTDWCYCMSYHDLWPFNF